MGDWPFEYRIPGKGWVNEGDLTGDDHLAIAELYRARARGEDLAPFKRRSSPADQARTTDGAET